MATQAVKGRRASLLMFPSTGNVIATRQARNWSLELTQEMIDASSADSSGWDEHIPGQRGWVFRAEQVYGAGTIGAAGDIRRLVRNFGLTGGGISFFRIALDVPSTSQVIAPTTHKGMWTAGLSTVVGLIAHVTNYRVGGRYDDVQLFEFEVRGTGTITYSS